MSLGSPAPSPVRRARPAVLVALAVALAVAVAAVVGLTGDRPSAAAPAASSPTAVPRADAVRAPAGAPPLDGRDADHGAVAAADGGVGPGVTVFDDDVPAVAKLDPDLLAALRAAATDAADDGVTFTVNSGWRSRAYQDRLLREAVATYGSAAEAARWVATADTSPHVRGAAVDVGGAAATAWLSEHGAEYGLCQVYANESWHFELRPGAASHGCPGLYADPTADPRMRQ